jgi:hypothetical protein
MPWRNQVLAFILVFAASAAPHAADDAGAGDAGNAKAELVHAMSAGLQNNVELRKMLAAKQIKEGDLDGAMAQYRHIHRIQIEKHGEGSKESAAAQKAAATHLQLLEKHERSTMEAFLQDPEGLVAGLTAEQKEVFGRNTRVKERQARAAAAEGDNARAGRLYR